MEDNIRMNSFNRDHNSDLRNNSLNEDIIEVSQENFELLTLTISSVFYCTLKCLIMVLPVEYLLKYQKEVNISILILVLSDILAVVGAIIANKIILILAIALSIFNLVAKIVTFFYSYFVDKSDVFDSFMHFYILFQELCGISLILEIIELLIISSLIYAIKNSDKITIGMHKSLIKRLFIGK